MDGDLLEDNSSYVGASLSETMGSFPSHLIHPFQVRGFFLPGTATDHFHIASIQRELGTPASVSPAPPASSRSL